MGFGSIGRAIARRLRGFECEVVAVARTAREVDGVPVHPVDALPELLPDADVVILIVPLTSATRGMVDAAFLARMRDGALLVNVARGPVVDTDALLAECASGRLRAALDVTDPEPLPADHPLWRTDGVLISPHVGGNTTAFLPRARRLVAEQVQRHRAGRATAQRRRLRCATTLAAMTATDTPSSPDIKPRSRDVTDGLERAAARGMLRAVGMGDEDWAKPQIGIASSWNEITPCNLSLDRLARSAKEGVHAGGGYPLQFGTISVSDGISMGHEGMHFSLVSREIIADSVETVMQAERLDGMVHASPAATSRCPAC